MAAAGDQCLTKRFIMISSLDSSSTSLDRATIGPNCLQAPHHDLWMSTIAGFPCAARRQKSIGRRTRRSARQIKGASTCSFAAMTVELLGIFLWCL
jgi:hypothetical protein